MRFRTKSLPALVLVAVLVMVSGVVTHRAGRASAADVTPQPSPTNFVGAFSGSVIPFDWSAPTGETAVRTGYSLTGFDIETKQPVSGSPFVVGPSITHAEVTGLPTDTIYAFRLTATYAAPDIGTPAPVVYVVGPTATALAGDVNQAPGGLVMTQVCGDYGALPSRAPTPGFPVLLPAADAVSGLGGAPTMGGIPDPNFPFYPYPVPGPSVPSTTTTTTTVPPTTTTVPATAPPATSPPTTTVPLATVPLATAPPTTTVPTTTVPPASVPPTTTVAPTTPAVPASTVPASTVPPTTVPPTTVPPSTVPPTTVPPSTVPATTTTLPAVNIPGTVVPLTPTSCGVQMGVGAPILDGELAGQYFALTGRMNQVTVVDLRPVPAGWTLNAVMSDVTHAVGGPNQRFTGAHLGVDPVITGQAGVPAGAPMGVVPGPAIDPMRPGLGVMQPLASAPAGSGTGVAVVDARLNMVMPFWTVSGDYHGTLTLTLI